MILCNYHHCHHRDNIIYCILFVDDKVNQLEEQIEQLSIATMQRYISK